MAILLKCDAVFLHIPKTGGSWVKKVLYDNNLVECEFSHEHADLERILHISGHYPGDYIRKSLMFHNNFEKVIKKTKKVCFIRHPISWYESVWKYMESISWKNFIKDENQSRFHMKYDTWHPFEKLYKYRSSNYNEFISGILKELPGFYTHLVYSYTGMNIVDFVGRQENLLEDLKKILYNLRIDVDNLYFEPERVNRSTISLMDQEQEPDLINRILEVEYPIIRKYYS